VKGSLILGFSVSAETSPAKTAADAVATKTASTRSDNLLSINLLFMAPPEKLTLLRNTCDRKSGLADRDFPRRRPPCGRLRARCCGDQRIAKQRLMISPPYPPGSGIREMSFVGYGSLMLMDGFPPLPVVKSSNTTGKTKESPRHDSRRRDLCQKALEPLASIEKIFKNEFFSLNP
jgi:hypothetical protein